MKSPLLAITTAVLTLASSGHSVAQDNNDKPNYVIIFTDDQGYADLGCFGGNHVKTPHIDKMAAEGIKLTRFYAAPVCTPSRASLMTGCYPRRVGLSAVLLPDSPNGIASGETTIAEVLKGSGYVTACIGKWHLGDQPEFMPLNHGFDYYFGLPYSNDMYPENDGKQRGFPPLPLIRNTSVVETQPSQETLTKRYTEESIAFIKKNKDQPFFLYLAHSMPHRPLYASSEFTRNIPVGTLAGKYPKSTKSRDFLYPNVIAEIDWSVGRILKTLMDLGLDRKTMVVFTSDNGPSRGGPGQTKPFQGRKNSVYEGGIRVPCVVRWPEKIPAASSFDGITSTMDLLPTVAALSGANLPQMAIDGRNITPVLIGTSTQSPHQHFFYYSSGNLKGVTDGQWKLLRLGEETSLFDLKNDPGEKTSLASKNPEIVVTLNAMLTAMEARLGNGNKEGHEQRPAGYSKLPTSFAK